MFCHRVSNDEMPLSFSANKNNYSACSINAQTIGKIKIFVWSINDSKTRTKLLVHFDRYITLFATVWLASCAKNLNKSKSSNSYPYDTIDSFFWHPMRNIHLPQSARLHFFAFDVKTVTITQF